MAQKSSSSRRFGPRYGKTVKSRLDTIEGQQKKSYICPYCNYKKVRRVSAGIWKCGKCGKKFTSRAFEVRPKSQIGKSEEASGE
jgi:large subunit ribosomal protein L37Ae